MLFSFYFYLVSIFHIAYKSVKLKAQFPVRWNRRVPYSTFIRLRFGNML